MDVDRASGDRRCPVCGGAHAGQACPQRPPAPAAAPGAGILPDPLVGSMVGSFRIQRLLGRGGMGTVYLAEHPVIGSKVAVKFLHESMCTSPELVGRFYDEARAVNLIGHENIVSIYDLALLPPSRYYIVMEYLDGSQLSSFLRAGRVEPPIATAILLQLTDALRAAHGRGIVHRDLKPENVFLLQRHGSPHFVKLVDFGIAKLADKQTQGRTAAGVIIGTPEYMAPEQCDNRPIDRRTDVYALGVMAYEMATGRLPFTGQGVPQLLLAQLTQAPAPPREVEPAVSPALERVVLKALAKSPAERFQDMAEFAAALEEAQRALGAPHGPSPESAAPAAPEDPAAAGLLVRFPDGEERRLKASEVSRGGLFLGLEEAPPPLFSTVTVALPGAAGPVELRGEVVRHVAQKDAGRWGMQAGFAVQFGSLKPSERQAVDALAKGREGRPERPAAPPPLTLEALERRAAAGPYELLGVRADMGFPEIRAGARLLRSQVDALRLRLPAEQQGSRVTEVLARIESALALLGTPVERLMFDARRGNFHGVAHCVTAGVTSAVLEARRRTLLAEAPQRGDEAGRQLARAQVAAKLGNTQAALAAYEAALQADPLDLSVHQSYWELKRRSESP
ncbi:MAG TPA: protein kinase [Anaeromyxobacteraceae bacterium]|nr:protein kinase [Anaeromyxobacteraceae bacterium]